MTEDEESVTQEQFNEATQGMPFFVRYWVNKLRRKHGLTTDASMEVAEKMASMHEQAKKFGEDDALYDFQGNRAIRFPWGKLIHVHKVREHRVVEYVEEDQTWFVAQEDESRWGRRWDSFDAALIDAIASHHEGWDSGAGYYAAKIAGAGKK